MTPTTDPPVRPVIRYRTQRGCIETWRGFPQSREGAAASLRRMLATEGASIHPWTVEWSGVEEVP